MIPLRSLTLLSDILALLLFSYIPQTFILVQCQSSNQIPNTWPQLYPGAPNAYESFSPEWQDYYEVTLPLPNITFGPSSAAFTSPPLTRSFAGNIPVNRAGHSNDTLFFWGFEKTNGSLTQAVDPNGINEEPWLIWLQGGPGSSGMIAFMTENGPIHITPNYTLVRNPFAWNGMADMFWIDQPVGTGYSTSDRFGYIANEDQMAEDFIGFLSNLVKIFPSLATRPLYLSGESYAGTYIPYITKGLLSLDPGSRPVSLRKIIVGDGSLGSLSVLEELPMLTVVETYPELIGFREEVLEGLEVQTHLCGYDLNLTYPQEGGHFPTLKILEPTDESSYLLDGNENGERNRVTSKMMKRDTERSGMMEKKEILKTSLLHHRQARLAKSSDFAGVHKDSALPVRRDGKLKSRRKSAYRIDATNDGVNASTAIGPNINPFYGCYLFDEVTDYAVNFSFPWSNGNFDVYNIPDGLNPEAPLDSSVFLNDNRTRMALHAPTSKDWIRNFDYPFGSVRNPSIGNQYGDPSVEPIAFLSDLAANATKNDVSIIFYSGNDDSLVSHRSTQVIIQNMTFGDPPVQGFTRVPSTSWFNDNGEFAGIVHQERNLTYVLFNGAGHMVPQYQPGNALVFLREFVLGSNETGLVVTSKSPSPDSNSMGTAIVVGGENSTLANDVLPGGSLFYYGSGTTAGTSTVPVETQLAWEEFIKTRTATATNTATVTHTGGGTTRSSTSTGGVESSASGTGSSGTTVSSTTISIVVGGNGSSTSTVKSQPTVTHTSGAGARADSVQTNCCSLGLALTFLGILISARSVIA